MMRQLARLFEEHEVSGFRWSTTRAVGRCRVPDRPDPAVSRPSATNAPGFFFQEIAEQLGEEAELEPEALIIVADIMTTDVVTAKPQDTLVSVSRLMTGGRVHRVVVVDPDNIPVGIITTMDMLKATRPPDLPVHDGRGPIAVARYARAHDPANRCVDDGRGG